MKIWSLTALLLWNVAVFVTYAIDKSRARRGAWRIPERTLLGMALALGGLGALLAGKLCHHKTRKWYFWAAWVLGVVLDVTALWALLILWKD